jgi:HAD superfamily hydrolase (TIGR01509 family)
VHGVPPLDPSLPSQRHLEAVLFDFHGTLAQVEDPVEWVLAAATECGASLERARATALADQLVTVGRAGGPRPGKVPPQLAEVYTDRDLDSYSHRAAYVGLASTVDTGIDGLSDALYERVLVPAGWRVYTDTVSVLAALHEAGVPIAVVSNIGFDIRPICAAFGFADYVSAWALSYEVGRCKPDPAIFKYACAALGVDAEATLMVGDSPADAAAVDAGCRALVIPSSIPGDTHGLGVVLSLAVGDH